MPVFQLILTSDTINQGREKINAAFSATTGLWSGSTGFQSLIHNNGTGNLASGDYAIATGSGTTASGDFSFSEGIETISQGINSHTSGLRTIAPSDNQFVIGKWNSSGNTTDGAFIIGNGTDNLNRRSILECPLDNNNAVRIRGLNDNNNNNAFEVVNNSNDSIFRVTGGGVGVNLQSPSGPKADLHVNGDIAHKDAYIDYSSTVTTTNNTPTELKTFVFKPTDTLVVLKVSVLAFNSSSNLNSGRYTKIYYVTAFRTFSVFGAGTAIIGVDTVHESVGASVSSSAIVSSGNIQIQATGNSSQTWTWICDFEVRETFTSVISII
jgi:hypothetical protein